MKTDQIRKNNVTALAYPVGMYEDNILLKKSFLATTIMFLVMLWVVFPASDIPIPTTGIYDPIPTLIEVKPPKKKPPVNTIRIKRKAAIIPDATPTLNEEFQEYIFESDNNGFSDTGYTFEPGEDILIVGVDVEMPNCFEKPEPVYPELARKARMEGMVILSVIWDTNGRIRSADVLSSTGAMFGFDASAVESVNKWECYPAMVNGRKVEIKGTVTIHFKLK